MKAKTLTQACLLAGAATLSTSTFAGLEGKIGDTEWKLGGFLELETTVLKAEGSESEFDMSANRSRVDFRTATDSEEGKVLGRLEFDFTGSDAKGSPTTFLRYANLKWNGWTIGQDLSTFSNPVAYHKPVSDGTPKPFKDDIGGKQKGTITSNQLIRSPMIAYGQKLGNGLSYQVGVEKNDKPRPWESTSDPQFAGRLTYNNKGPFAAQLAAATYTHATTGDKEWKGLLGARYKVGNLSFRLGYVNDDGGDTKSTSGSVRYNFDKKNWVSAIYESADVAGEDRDRGYLNYYHQLTKTVQIGFEYQEFGISGDNSNDKIYRMDIKKFF